MGTYPTKAEALSALEQTAGKTLTDHYNLTFAEVFSLWKEEHYKKITAAGIATYDRSFDVFSELHDRKFRILRTADFQAVLDRHMHKAYSTVSKYKQLLTQMSSWAIREELITTNFASFVRLPENRKTEKVPFTAEEISAITEIAGNAEDKDHETAKIIVMLLSTGMRIGELFSLTVSDCKPDGAETPTYVIGGEKTDAGRNRVIPIRPEGRCAFAYFKSKAVDERLLSGFCGNRNKRTFRSRNYYSLLDRLGISRSKTPHTTRHTYTSQAVEAGMSPTDLQKVLGHANFSTTADIYTHSTPEALVEAVEAVSSKKEMTE